ncbi:hypothetical protein L7F22_018669 [Adiantum nelumboides]|nr:hypothetical protein [Adiantum nelumboides]
MAGEASGSAAAGESSRSGYMTRGGLPRYAGPWLEMGKLQERERWQGFTAQLLQGAIAFELDDLKRSMVEALATPVSSATAATSQRPTWGRALSSVPRSGAPIPADLKHSIISSIDSSKARISSIFADYIKFFTSGTKPMHEGDAMEPGKVPKTLTSSEETSSAGRLSRFQSLGLFIASMLIMRLLALESIVI